MTMQRNEEAMYACEWNKIKRIYFWICSKNDSTCNILSPSENPGSWKRWDRPMMWWLSRLYRSGRTAGKREDNKYFKSIWIYYKVHVHKNVIYIYLIIWILKLSRYICTKFICYLHKIPFNLLIFFLLIISSKYICIKILNIILIIIMCGITCFMLYYNFVMHNFRHIKYE